MLGDVAIGATLLAIGAIAGAFGPRLWRRTGLESVLDVHVEKDPRIFEAGMPDWIPYAVVVDRPPESVESPPAQASAQEWRAWGHSIGGIDGWSTKLQITIVGRQNVTVVVDALSVDMTSVPHPTTGTLIVRPTGGADVTVRGIEVELDTFTNPTTRYRDSGGGDLPSLNLALQKGEVARLQVEAKANSSECHWKARLHLLVDGKRRTVELSDDGAPFITAGAEHLTAYTWDDTRWARFA